MIYTYTRLTLAIDTYMHNTGSNFEPAFLLLAMYSKKKVYKKVKKS
jgi:hypothetical protein